MRDFVDGILRIHGFVFIVVVLTYLMVLVCIVGKIARAVLLSRLLRCASIHADKLPYFRTVLQPNALGISRNLVLYLCRSPPSPFAAWSRWHAPATTAGTEVGTAACLRSLCIGRR